MPSRRGIRLSAHVLEDGSSTGGQSDPNVIGYCVVTRKGRTILGALYMQNKHAEIYVGRRVGVLPRRLNSVGDPAFDPKIDERNSADQRIVAEERDVLRAGSTMASKPP